MRSIDKGPEPAELSAWKARNACHPRHLRYDGIGFPRGRCAAPAAGAAPFMRLHHANPAHRQTVRAARCTLALPAISSTFAARRARCRRKH